MSHWNYRAIEFIGLDGEPYRQIHEVYYDEAGAPNAYTESPAGAVGQSNAEIRTVLRRMMKCLTKPVLSVADFSTEPRDETEDFSNL